MQQMKFRVVYDPNKSHFVFEVGQLTWYLSAPQFRAIIYDLERQTEQDFTLQFPDGGKVSLKNCGKDTRSGIIRYLKAVIASWERTYGLEEGQHRHGS